MTPAYRAEVVAVLRRAAQDHAEGRCASYQPYELRLAARTAADLWKEFAPSDWNSLEHSEIALAIDMLATIIEAGDSLE